MANRLEAVIYPFQPARGLTTELEWDRAEQHDENDWGLNDAGSPKWNKQSRIHKEGPWQTYLHHTSSYRVVWCRQRNDRLHQTPEFSMRRVI